MFNEVITKLHAPFDTKLVSFRVGPVTKKKDKCIGLAYITARDVMERLDNAVGPENWSDTYPHVGGQTVCSISIKIDGEWVTKSDGAGATDIEGAKGALSDAFKRAGVKWGIARYLYEMPNIWVPIDEYKNITDDGLKRLRNELKTLSETVGVMPVDTTQVKNSAYKAKKNGDYERLKEDLFSQEFPSHLVAWGKSAKDDISKLPTNFAVELREDYRSHLETLNTLHPEDFDGSSD